MSPENDGALPDRTDARNEPAMRVKWRSNLDLGLTRLFYFDLRKTVVYCYVVISLLIYVSVAAHTPLSIYVTAPHDDTLFMSLGRYLSEGTWLGPYNEFTLMKGPGYPVFLALSNWLGISVSLAHALFHCASVVIFVWVAHKFIRSLLLSGLLFTLLLWHPVLITVVMLRILREQIYSGQLLLVLALFAYALFVARSSKQRNASGIFAGAVLGWFWLTREEGIWILPGIGVLVAAAILHVARERRLRALAVTLAIVVGVFAATQFTFRVVNSAIYGTFIGVDFKEANFQRTLGALHSVRSGGTKPFVSVTLAARERIYPVSPTFAKMSRYLDGPPDQGWARISCEAQPASCGEIGSGWFMWAVRGSATQLGKYSSPRKASRFFGKIADEITSACDSGALECAPQLVAEMAPWTWAQLADLMPQRYLDALDLLLFQNPPLQFNPSSGTEDDLEAGLRFLNYPRHTGSSQIPPRLAKYTLNGWYYSAGSDWFTISVRAANGSLADVHVDRNPSPDIAEGAKDPEASDQRFRIRVPCSDDCVLQVRTLEGEEFETTLGALGTGLIAFKLGKAHFQIESTTARAPYDPLLPTAADRFTERIRVAIVSHYEFVFIPTLILGVIAFLAATVFHWRKATWNVCYMFALAFWLLVFSRATLLILIAVTSFPALGHAYFAPAYFMAIAGAVFSLAAWLQLSGFGLRSTGPLGDSAPAAGDAARLADPLAQGFPDAARAG